MADTRTFKRYNYITGAVDGTLAYDFGNPKVFPRQEEYEKPRRARRPQSQDWVREGVREETQTIAAKPAVSPLTAIGYVCVVILLALMLLAQIQLLDIATATGELETQISELRSERDKLTAEYENVFTLKEVEEYAVSVLGMQEPVDSQIRYLTGVSAADRAIIITQENTNMFSQGVEDIVASVKAYFD